MAVVLKKKQFRWTAEYVKEEGLEKHKGKYNYDLVTNPITSESSIKILCNDCGEIFNQRARHHIKLLCGCKNCKGLSTYTPDKFIEKAMKIGNNAELFDYSIVAVMDTLRSTMDVKIGCNVCGDIFIQNAGAHLNSKCGCPGCKGRIPYDYNLFIKKAKETHGNDYDYSLISRIDPLDSQTKVEIICNACQFQFPQRITSHVNDGCGCPRCAGVLPYTRDIFIEKAIKKHGDSFDYSNVSTTDKLTTSIKVDILCRKCINLFKRSIGSHIHHGSGCPKCNRSVGELIIEKYLLDNFISYNVEYTLSTLKKKRFDFIIPDKKCLIEYDGIQHFYRREYFYKTQEKFDERRMIDVQKSIAAIKEGYTLIRISYNVNNIIQCLLKAFETECDMFISDETLYSWHTDKVLYELPEARIKN